MLEGVILYLLVLLRCILFEPNLPSWVWFILDHLAHIGMVFDFTHGRISNTFLILETWVHGIRNQDVTHIGKALSNVPNCLVQLTESFISLESRGAQPRGGCGWFRILHRAYTALSILWSWSAGSYVWSWTFLWPFTWDFELILLFLPIVMLLFESWHAFLSKRNVRVQHIGWGHLVHLEQPACLLHYLI